MDKHLYTHELEYITKGNIALHTIIILSLAQASCFKYLNMYMFTYATPAFITKMLNLFTQVQLHLMNVTVN